MIKLVIFDLDGTLVDTIDGIGYCANLVLKEYGMGERDRKFYLSVIGHGARSILEGAILSNGGDIGVLDEMLNKYLDYYDKHWDVELVQYDGIEELVSSLIKKGIKIAVNTNKPQKMAADIVKKYYGTEEGVIVIGESKEYEKKPSPQAVLEIMKHFDVRAEECIYIGDSIVDIKTAKNANVKSIGVLWGYGKEEDVKKADFYVNHAKEILEVIENIK